MPFLSCEKTAETWIISENSILILRGNCTPNQKLACFVLYLKINNTILKNNICIL